MARSLRRAKPARMPGTPSARMESLAAEGEAARMAWLMEAEAPDHLKAAMARLRRERADRYDAHLAEALAGVEGIRREAGDAAADAVSLRYVDGLAWRDVADALGMSVAGAARVAGRALDLLDAMG